MVCGLSDVSGVHEVVIRVAELTVALLETRQETVQRLSVYLSHNEHALQSRRRQQRHSNRSSALSN